MFSYNLCRSNQSYLQTVFIFNEAIKFKIYRKLYIDYTAFEAVKAKVNRLYYSFSRGNLSVSSGKQRSGRGIRGTVWFLREINEYDRLIDGTHLVSGSEEMMTRDKGEDKMSIYRTRVQFCMENQRPWGRQGLAVIFPGISRAIKTS